MQIVKPKGKLIPIGGGDGIEVIHRLIKETGKEHPKICYITVATADLKDAQEQHKHFFDDVGKKNASIIHFDNRSEADQPANLKKIKACDAVLIGGGNQLRLSSLLGGTTLIDIIKKRYYDEPYFVVSGSSAGAAAMSNTMIVSGNSCDAFQKGRLQLTNGLDLINNVFIDTHFTERGRFGRLMQTVAYNPGVLGLGLSMDTAAVVYDGDHFEIIGSGVAMIVDGSSIDYCNLTEISNEEPMTVEGLRIHILGAGKSFSISKRELIKPKPAKKTGT